MAEKNKKELSIDSKSDIRSILANCEMTDELREMLTELKDRGLSK